MELLLLLLALFNEAVFVLGVDVVEIWTLWLLAEEASDEMEGWLA